MGPPFLHQDQPFHNLLVLFSSVFKMQLSFHLLQTLPGCTVGPGPPCQVLLAPELTVMATPSRCAVTAALLQQPSLDLDSLLCVSAAPFSDPGLSTRWASAGIREHRRLTGGDGGCGGGYEQGGAGDLGDKVVLCLIRAFKTEVGRLTEGWEWEDGYCLLLARISLPPQGWSRLPTCDIPAPPLALSLQSHPFSFFLSGGRQSIEGSLGWSLRGGLERSEWWKG